MELSKKSELTVGASSFVVNTKLAGDGSPSIQTEVLGTDGSVVFETSEDISALRPIFQNGQNVFARMEAQHQRVMTELKEGRLNESDDESESSSAASPPPTPVATSTLGPPMDALSQAVTLLGDGNFEKATAALRAILEAHSDCSEARELLEVAYKASGARLPVDIESALKRGTEAFVTGRQRDAIESWKQCLIEEPGNRSLQLLVLLATTWSPERRAHYANEVLDPSNSSLSTGRPEETQALLLVAQTVEDAPGPAPASTPDETPSSRPAPAVPAPDSEPSGPEVLNFEDPEALESLVPDASETTVIVSEEEPPYPLSDEATPVAAARPPESAPPSSLPSPPSPEATLFERPEPEASTAERSRPAIRRPVSRAKRPDLPWRLLGGIAAGAAALIVLAGALVWLFSGGNSVPTGRLEQAESYVRSGQYDQAVVAYDTLLAEFGERAEIYEGRGRARVASSDVDGGLADLKRALEMDPRAPGIAEEIGDGYYSRGLFPEAIEYYEKAFAGGQGSAEGRYRLSVSLVQKGDGDAALPYLEQAISSDSSHGEAQFLYAQLLNERGRFREAEKALRAAEAHVEAGGDFLAQMAIALLGQEKHDEAEEVARSFIRAYPSDARAHGLLGEIYLSRKQYEPARAELIQALRTDRNEPRAQIALGRTWLAIGKVRGDRGDLAKARQVLTSAKGVHEGERLLALGQVALADGDLETAERFLRSSLDHGAAELPARLSLAESRARGDDLVGAAEEIQRASGLAPEDPAISLSLAIAYSQLEEPTRAAEEFLKSIQGAGLVTPAGEDAGPVMLPAPYIPIPEGFDVNQAIHKAFEDVLELRETDPAATELQKLADSTTFVLGTS